LTPQNTSRIALVTGANRGLGFESARQLGRIGRNIVLTSRDAAAGKTAAHALATEGLDVTSHPLDIVDPASVARIAAHVNNELGRVDVLVNNGGVFLDAMESESASVFRSDPDVLRRTLEVNLIGHLRMCQALVPGMKARRYGRVVNVSSTLGQLSDMGGGPERPHPHRGSRDARVERARQLRLSRPRPHRDGRTRRTTFSRGGSGHDRLARHAARRRGNRRLLP